MVVDSTASGEFLKGTNLVYLIIHGERSKTGKLVLADAKPEKNSSDLVFHLTAPEVGKVGPVSRQQPASHSLTYVCL